MDFSIHTNTRFKAGIDFYPRLFKAHLLKNGNVIIKHIFKGYIIFNLPFNSIFIEGVPLQNVDDLQSLIYNFECGCDPSLDDDNTRIFDDSFDNTFE